MKSCQSAWALSPPNLAENAEWSVGGGSGLEKGLWFPQKVERGPCFPEINQKPLGGGGFGFGVGSTFSVDGV